MEGQNAQGQAAPGHMDWPGFANAMGQAIAANLHNLQEPGQQDPAQRAQQALRWSLCKGVSRLLLHWACNCTSHAPRS